VFSWYFKKQIGVYCLQGKPIAKRGKVKRVELSEREKHKKNCNIYR
jgi:hypothetical protein